ncbi:MAG: hypothetical protein AAFU85_32890 [Planctomycetota bacterium]
MQRLLFAALASFLCTYSVSADRLTPERLWDLARIGDAVVSPDGKTLAFLVTRFDLAENKGTTSLLLQPLPADELSTGKKSVAFDSPLATAESKTLLADISGPVE